MEESGKESQTVKFYYIIISLVHLWFLATKTFFSSNTLSLCEVKLGSGSRYLHGRKAYHMRTSNLLKLSKLCLTKKPCCTL